MQFNTKATNKQDLFKELKEMDARIKPKGAAGALGQQMQAIEEASQGQTMDKRLAMYKNLRGQIHSALRSDQDQED